MNEQTLPETFEQKRDFLAICKPLLQRCKTVEERALFVETVRNFIHRKSLAAVAEVEAKLALLISEVEECKRTTALQTARQDAIEKRICRAGQFIEEFRCELECILAEEKNGAIPSEPVRDLVIRIAMVEQNLEDTPMTPGGNA